MADGTIAAQGFDPERYDRSGHRQRRHRARREPTGAISVYPNGNTDLIIDIDGYFAPSNSGPDPLSLYTLPPCRVLDTRHGGNGTFSGMIPVAVLASPCNVPSAQAYVLNATVIPYQGHPMGYLSLWPDAEGQPLVSTLNAADGALTSNMAIVPTLNGSIDSFAQNPTDMILDIFSYFAPITSLGITTTSLPAGALNFPYDVTLGASGGVPPYSWSLLSGTLPTGLNPLTASGAITGTPTAIGTYPFTVQVADSQSPPATATAPLSITVNATLAPLTVVTTSLPVGTQNTGYSAMLAANGGVTPYTWSITAGNLPRGLSLNTITGAILGTPSGGGTSNFTVQVTDSNTPAANASAPLSITVTAAVPLSITTTSLPAGLTGTAYSAPLTAIGGVSPYTWSRGQRQPAAWFAVEPDHRRDLRHADHGGDVELHRAGGRLGNAARDRRQCATQHHHHPEWRRQSRPAQRTLCLLPERL